MAEVADVLAQHPPAVKVAGRRLSISKPKHHPHQEPVQPEIAERDNEPTDYPRPNPPAELIAGNEHNHEHAHYEEEVPRNEKKQQQGYEIEKKLRTVKPDVNMPTRDNISGGGGARRIDQPAGKGFGI